MSTSYDESEDSSAKFVKGKIQWNCEELENFIQGMDEWQRQNLKGAWIALHPKADRTGSLFREFIDTVDDELYHTTVDTTTYTDKPKGRPHKGFLLEPAPRGMQAYRAFLRPEAWKDVQKETPKSIGDFGEDGIKPLEKGKGLKLEAYCRLFWVLEMQLRHPTYQDERQVPVTKGLNSISFGGAAMT